MSSNPANSRLIGNRVVVTGMAGAGKSTFARMLARQASLPLIHLDLHSWDPGWVRVPAARMQEKQRLLLAAEQWIVDSNDVDSDILMDRADTLVILATPWWLCAWRAFLRGIRRPPGTELPAGCEESAGQRLRDEWGIVWRNWRHRDRTSEENAVLASHCRGLMQVHVLDSKPAIVALLQAAMDGAREAPSKVAE